ncbi:MAG TPA: NAD(P)/FAD-dependent oxidoreductase [Candidatus Hydrogenedentes bacterium]|nr:NAD(P)/FAD-dependent oxidoreductase [Candidatus Hydrogenedentota bacterium]
MAQIVIIGGGASGLVAAIMAGRNEAGVTVLERMQRVGKKLLATGNGRCNLANRHLDVSHYHGTHPEFIEGIFAQFGLEKTLAFFESLGVDIQEEDEGRLFPSSGQASSVLDVLRYEMEQLGAAEVCDTIVQSIQCAHGALRCVCGNGHVYEADRVIVCAGGKSTPNLGSNGGGFKLAQGLGHTIIEPFPALVQVCLDAPYLNQIAGVAIQGKAEVLVDGESRGTEIGELLFAKYGISGSAILKLSRQVSEYTVKGRDTHLRLDLFPAISQGALYEQIRQRIMTNSQKPTNFCFVGCIHKRLIPILLREACISNPARPCGDLSSGEIEQIATAMKGWTIPCSGTQSWMFSQVTAGGVDIREVDSVTLESKRAPGVYFAGEVLDIDGDSGGYNLQWAWASGAVAGLHASTC